MKKLILVSILFFFKPSIYLFAQKIDAEQNNGCNAVGIGDLKEPNKYDFYPRFTDTNIPLEINSGKTVNLKMYISCYIGRGYEYLPMNGTLTDAGGTVINTWNSVFNYTFNIAGTFYLNYTSLCNNVPCKAGTKRIIVKSRTGLGSDTIPKKDDYVTLNTETVFTNSLDISTGRKYYKENNVNPNVVREANWELVDGPTGKTYYPTYAWTVLGNLSADISNNNEKLFNGAHWVTLINEFKNTTFNMQPLKPFKFVKKFEMKQADNVYLQLKTLYDNHLAIYLDGKRLFLHHPIKKVEEIINKPILKREDYESRRETFNYSYNASYITKADGNIFLNAGVHNLVAELSNHSQEIGFIISGEILSTTNKKNNFKPIGFSMYNLIKGGGFFYEKENIIPITQAPPYKIESKLQSEKWSVKFIKDKEIENGSIIKLKFGTVKKIGIDFLQTFIDGHVEALNSNVIVKMPNGDITTFYNYRKFYFKTLGKYDFSANAKNENGEEVNFNFIVEVE